MSEPKIDLKSDKKPVAPSDFVHLHLHSQYSLLDGACRIDGALKLANEYGMQSMAITDHGNMFGVMEFYKAARKANVKPIIGCEMYVAPNSRFDTKAGPDDPVKEKNYHLILLAKNENGYQNLTKLSSQSYLEGFYYKPRIDWELLQQYHEDLICLTACIQGEVPRAIRLGQEDKALEKAGQLSELFGKDNFYLELQENGYDEQMKVNRGLIELSKKLNLPLVATNDCHYLRKTDARTHDILLCIQTGKTVDDPNRMKFQTDEFYFKSPEEMKQRFKEIPQAVLNTVKIAEQTNIKFNYDHYLLPNYEVPAGYQLDSYFEELAWSGLKERYPIISPAIEERFKYELGIIKTMGFSAYFLIVWDFIHYARQIGIPVGPGRGSAAGSLVSYALKITTLDPLKYGLIFERFLNPGRISMPDIDIDFCYERRGEIIEYVTQKYGKENVCQIITFGTMAAKNAIRDVGRAMRIPLPDVDRIAKLVPTGPDVTLEKAIDEVDDLKKEIKQSEQIKTLLEVAKSVEGFPRHASTHAAGVVISPGPLTDYIPLYKAAGSTEITTQFDMKVVADDIKLIKIDFLGLRTLTVIDDAVKLIKKRRGIVIDLDNLPLEDKKVYELFSHADTDGIFQLESGGMRNLLRRLTPSTFEDISAVIALYRPGPLGSGMIDDFVDRRHGRIPMEYMHPLLENILKSTYGVMVYQEQVMQIASTLAKFSMSEADNLRKAMGKKSPEVMAKMESKFIDGCKANQVDPKIGKDIWDLIVKFAGYGFNKSHTACYAWVAFQTAYLKTYYPVEFMASLLTSEMGNQDKMVGYIKACRMMGICVMPPDINESYRNFTVIDDRTMRFGLAAVKNVGEAAIQVILAERKKGPFQSLFDFCQRIDTGRANSKVIECLIKCGAFDSLGAHRSQMLDILPAAMEQGSSFQTDKDKGQISLFGNDDSSAEDSSMKITFKPLAEFTDHDLLTFEKELLGFYVSGHPLMQYESAITHYTNITAKEINDNPSDKVGKTFSLAGVIVEKKIKRTKKGTLMADFMLEDLSGVIPIRAFSEGYEKHKDLIEKDKIVHLVGKVDSFNDNISVTLFTMLPLQEAVAKLTTSFHIRIPLDGFSTSQLDDIHKVIESNPGSLKTFLEFYTTNTEEDQLIELATDANSRVAYYPGMIANIEAILDRDCCWFSNKG